jgi:hypothetical protein
MDDLVPDEVIILVIFNQSKIGRRDWIKLPPLLSRPEGGMFTR